MSASLDQTTTPRGSLGRREALIVAAGAIVLTLPTVLAFLSGGYFATGRAWGLVAAWLAFLLVAVSAPTPIPSRIPGALVLSGLVWLALLTALSLGAAPLLDPAVDDLARLLLYLPYTAAAIAAFDRPELRRWAAPGLLAGTAIVCGYALAGRLAPTVVKETVGAAAAGRLDQPITYWNAMGIVAAIGLILAASLCCDRRRALAGRTLAAATVPLLAMALAFTLSRGGIVAAITGLLIVVVCCRSKVSAISCILVAAIGLLAAAIALSFTPLRELTGSASDRAGDGLILLLLLIVISVLSSLALRYLERYEDLNLPRLATASISIGLVTAVLVGFALTAWGSTTTAASTPAASGANPSRLASVKSSRSAYWDVAINSFAQSPALGKGPGSFRVEWRRERPFPEAAKDAHSLYIETAAELGLAGLLGLAIFLVGAVLASVRAVRVDRRLASGPVAVLAAWAVHAGLEWDWEMPAVSLIALASLGALCSLSATSRAADT
ncbi:MAG: O-antigen ligase family protein [Actinomycetes bacterium]